MHQTERIRKFKCPQNTMHSAYQRMTVQ